MPISFQCPGCSKPYDVTDDWGGKPCRCACGTNLLVPFAQPAAAICFQCPQCHRPYQLGPEWAGKASRCGCGAVLTVPAPARQLASPLLSDLLDEALAPPKPVPRPAWEQAPPAHSGYQPHPGSHGGYATSAAAYGGYERPTTPRRRRAEMPSFVAKTIVGLYGASGLSVLYCTFPFIIYLSRTEGFPQEPIGYVVLVLYLGWQLITFTLGITCAQLLTHRSSFAVPVCSLCGVWFIFSIFPLGWLFALVLWISLFASRDMQEWLAKD